MSSVIVRPFNSSVDSGFIFSSYPKGVYHGSSTAINPVSDTTSKEYRDFKDQWFKAFFEHVKHQLATAQVFIACLAEDPDAIIGYCIINSTTLEFIYIKEPYRKQGIAKLLIKNKEIKNVNNITRVGSAILAKHPELQEGTSNEK